MLKAPELTAGAAELLGAAAVASGTGALLASGFDESPAVDDASELEESPLLDAELDELLLPELSAAPPLEEELPLEPEPSPPLRPASGSTY